jgi:hypothetical protein
MRLVCSLAAAMVALSVSSAVFACGGEAQQVVQRPVMVVKRAPENPLLVRARQLETSANNRQMQANRDDQRAARLENTARQLRMMANEIDGVEGSNLILSAGQLGLRARQTKRRAQLRHAQARQLRAQARQLRMTANGVVARPMKKRRHRRRGMAMGTI